MKRRGETGSAGSESVAQLQARLDRIERANARAFNRVRQVLIALREAGAPLPEPESAIDGRPIVVTSINPFGRTKVQLACFKRWQDLGFRIYTCNSKSEITPLTELGISPDSIIELSETETGLAIHGKRVPKIVSVLDKVANLFGDDILLVNSDLFPDADDGTFVDTWQEAGKLLAFVREDQLALGAYVTGLTRPYTNGLDAFLLPQEQFPTLLRQLKSIKVSERMCFGIVGWDFLMGALILRNGGGIRNSELLMHEYHEATYTEISEFQHYNSAMLKLGFGVANDYLETAEDFAQTIDKHCVASLDEVPSVRLERKSELTDLGSDLRSFYQEMEAEMPDFLLSFGRSNVIGLLKTVESRVDLPISDVFRGIQRMETLNIFLLYMIIFIARWRLGVRCNDVLRSDYPDGNAHAGMIDIIRRKFSENPAQLRNAIAELFFVELSEHSIFNKRIFNFLVHNCENDMERALMWKVRALGVEEVVHVA